MSRPSILKMKLNHLFSVTEELEEKEYGLVKLRREIQEKTALLAEQHQEIAKLRLWKEEQERSAKARVGKKFLYQKLNSF